MKYQFHPVEAPQDFHASIELNGVILSGLLQAPTIPDRYSYFQLDLYELSFLVQPLFPQHRGYHHKFETPIQTEFQIALMHPAGSQKRYSVIHPHNRHIESKRPSFRDGRVEAAPTSTGAVHLECRQLAR